ncbi:hypothetical protein Tco_0871595 [Tanacetum coccineum]
MHNINGSWFKRASSDAWTGRYSHVASPVEEAEKHSTVAAHEEVETITQHDSREQTLPFKLKGSYFLILTGIGDETLLNLFVACTHSEKEMWTAHEKMENPWSLINPRTCTQRSNATFIKQSSSTRNKCVYQTKAKRSPKPVTPQSESVSEEDSDRTSSEEKDMPKELGTLLLRECMEANAGLNDQAYLKEKDTDERLLNKNWYKANDDDRCVCQFNTSSTEISVVKQKYDELVKKSLLTRSQFEGQLKEKTKVISDLKVKEGKDIDTMIEMDKQIKFLNEILYKRNQSIQTIHMLAPKCATYHGRSTFANPKYLKKAQSDKPRLYEIPYDTSDPANRFCPNGEETVTLEKESRSKLDKDTVKPYNYTYQNSLYETFKPPSKAYLDQLERAKEVRKTMWRKTFVRTNNYFMEVL